MVVSFLGAMVMPASALAAPVDLSAAGQNATHPEVAVGVDGSATVAWIRSDGSNSIVQAVRLSATDGTPGTVRDLSAPGQNALDPQVAVAADGTPTVTWIRSDGSNSVVQAVRLSATDGTPGTVRALSAPGRDAFNPQVAVAADGTSTVTWWRSAGSNFIVQAVRLSATDGTPGTVRDLSAPGQNALDPQVAVAADGTPTVTWIRFSGADYIVQAVRLSATDGTPGTVRDLSVPGYNAFNPQVAVAADGTSTVTWWRYSGANWIVHAVRLSATDGTPGTVRDLSAPGQDASPPQVAVAADGTPTVTWYRYNGANVIVQAVRLSATDGTPGTVRDLSTAGKDAFSPQVAVAADGTPTVTWQRFGGSNYVVQAVRLSATDGTPGTVRDLSTAGQNGSEPHPQVAVAADGTSTVTWQRYSGANDIVQAARLAPPDTAAPTSSASAPSITNSPSIAVAYTASDTGGSGLAKVELYAKAPGAGAYSLAATDTTPSASGESFAYTAAGGDGAYAFYTRAYDAAANAEAAPASPDATTTLDTATPATTDDAPTSPPVLTDTATATRITVSPGHHVVAIGGKVSVGCAAVGGPLRNCTARITTANGTVLARGSTKATSPRTTKVAVILSRTRAGRFALRANPRGLPAFIEARLTARDGHILTKRIAITFIAADWVTVPTSLSATLTPASKRRITALRSILNAAKRVSCVSYTSVQRGVGAWRANQHTLRQATAACALVKHLAPRVTAVVVTRGHARPLATNATAAGRTLNRRTVIRLA